MLGLAALGGHIKNNGTPGWLVPGRGLTRFFETQLGWRLARDEMSSIIRISGGLRKRERPPGPHSRHRRPSSAPAQQRPRFPPGV